MKTFYTNQNGLDLIEANMGFYAGQNKGENTFTYYNSADEDQTMTVNFPLAFQIKEKHVIIESDGSVYVPERSLKHVKVGLNSHLLKN
jgi:hypothetical protein